MTLYKDLENKRAVTEEMIQKALDEKYLFEVEGNDALLGESNRLVTKRRAYFYGNAFDASAYTDSNIGNRIVIKENGIADIDSLGIPSLVGEIMKILVLSDGTYVVSVKSSLDDIQNSSQYKYSIPYPTSSRPPYNISTGGMVVRYNQAGEVLNVYPFRMGTYQFDASYDYYKNVGIYDMIEYQGHIVCVGYFDSYDATSIGKTGSMGSGSLAVIDFDGNLITSADIRGQYDSVSNTYDRAVVYSIDKVSDNDFYPNAVIIGGDFRYYNGYQCKNIIIDINGLFAVNPNPVTLQSFLGIVDPTALRDDVCYAVYAEKVPYSFMNTRFYAGTKLTSKNWSYDWTDVIKIDINGVIDTNFNLSLSRLNADYDPQIHSIKFLSNGNLIVGGRFRHHRDPSDYKETNNAIIVNPNNATKVYYFTTECMRYNVMDILVEDGNFVLGGLNFQKSTNSLGVYNGDESNASSLLRFSNDGDLISIFGAQGNLVYNLFGIKEDYNITSTVTVNQVNSIAKIPNGLLTYINEDIVLYNDTTSSGYSYLSNIKYSQHWRPLSEFLNTFNKIPHLPAKKVNWVAYIPALYNQQFKILVDLNDVLGTTVSQVVTDADRIYVAQGTASASGSFNVYQTYPLGLSELPTTMRLDITLKDFGAGSLSNLVIYIKDKDGAIIATGTLNTAERTVSKLSYVIPAGYDDISIQIGVEPS